MKRHILLIDAVRSELPLFMEVFRELKSAVKCTYTESCEHAQQMLEFLSVDCIFLHLDPNIADSLEFVRNIKRKKNFKNIPVVVYSKNMPYYNFLARGHGADHCLQRPVDTEIIKKTIAAILLMQPNFAA